MSECGTRRRKCTFSSCFVRVRRQYNCGLGACPPRSSDQNKCCDRVCRACAMFLASCLWGVQSACAVEAHVLRAIADSTIAGAALACPAAVTRTATVNECAALTRALWPPVLEAR